MKDSPNRMTDSWWRGSTEHGHHGVDKGIYEFIIWIGGGMLMNQWGPEDNWSWVDLGVQFLQGKWEFSWLLI